MRTPMLSEIALGLSCIALGMQITNCTIKDARIRELETERDIYASRFQNWSERAMRDEETISELESQLDQLLDGAEAVLDGNIQLEDAGVFLCTAYCTERYPHICGTGTGITASGQPVKADVTVAADQTLLPYGTILYIEGVGVRIVQDKGAGVQGSHLDVAVSGSHEDALNWDGYGEHRVWIIKEAD